MSVGLDSIAVTEFSTRVSKLLDQELAQTLVFDHPTLRSIADFLLTQGGTSRALEEHTEQRTVSRRK